MNHRTLLTRLSKAMLAVTCAAAFALPASAAEYTMKIGIIAQNDPLHAYIKKFKERIETASNGRIEAKLYPGAQLGGESALVEGVQLGTVEMVVVPAVYFKGLDPRFQVADAPGLFEGLDHAYASLQSDTFRDPFLAIADENGMHGVSLWVYDMTAFATKKPFNQLDDLEGRKLRVLASELERTIMRELGATAVPMPFVEVVPALQRGTIDGVRTSPIIMAAFKVPTVAKYLTETNDGQIAIGAYVSNRFYKSLPEDLQQAVDEAGRAVDDEMHGLVSKVRQMMLQRWEELGGERSTLSAEQHQRLLEINREVGKTMLGEDPKTAELYELLKKAAAETK